MGKLQASCIVISFLFLNCCLASKTFRAFINICFLIGKAASKKNFVWPEECHILWHVCLWEIALAEAYTAFFTTKRKKMHWFMSCIIVFRKEEVEIWAAQEVLMIEAVN